LVNLNDHSLNSKAVNFQLLGKDCKKYIELGFNKINYLSLFLYFSKVEY